MVLLLRAAIPAGYMPAVGGKGLLFEICPESLPAGFMQLLAGEHGPHHHADNGKDRHHCPVGQMLLPAFAVGDHMQFQATPPIRVFAVVPKYAFTAVFSAVYLSRGPPA